jgi:hypothetical protein
LWLLTNITLSPERIVTVAGLRTPFAPIVIVAPMAPVPPPPGLGFGDGAVLEPPQLTASTNPEASASHFQVLLFMTLSLVGLGP